MREPPPTTIWLEAAKYMGDLSVDIGRSTIPSVLSTGVDFVNTKQDLCVCLDLCQLQPIVCCCIPPHTPARHTTVNRYMNADTYLSFPLCTSADLRPHPSADHCHHPPTHPIHTPLELRERLLARARAASSWALSRALSPSAPAAPPSRSPPRCQRAQPGARSRFDQYGLPAAMRPPEGSTLTHEHTGRRTGD